MFTLTSAAKTPNLCDFNRQDGLLIAAAWGLSKPALSKGMSKGPLSNLGQAAA